MYVLSITHSILLRINPVPHAVTLIGNNGEMFRGFLAVTTNGAGQRVGRFAASPDGQIACDVSVHSVI